MLNSLPIDAITPQILTHLREKTTLTLVAAPGAGKTTKLPLSFLNETWAKAGKILLLEPRRVAARAASARLALNLGEEVGETIGLRIRFNAKVSAQTRLEVMTEGVFTRLILENPLLEGIAGVIFDEFHERSLDSDFGLALALDCQKGLREDLKIIVMSATLDGASVAKLLNSTVIESEGRAFPVTPIYKGREVRIEQVVLTALKEQQGSVLVFLPGQSEILRTKELLENLIQDKTIDICPLFGAMNAIDQDKAIQPSVIGRRKIVLATSLAETSLTIEGVRVVIDSGLSRVPKYDIERGITRLETVRASRATITQRMGRAGRTQAGVCYRLWDEAQNLALPAFATPEIQEADLTQMVLDCAFWGADPLSLDFLDMPPLAALKSAKETLLLLGAIDESGRITSLGKTLQKLPLSPRLAAMVIRGNSKTAAFLALLLSEHGLGGLDVNLETRLNRFLSDKSERAKQARQMALRWNNKEGEDNLGLLLSFVFPERIAKARGKTGDYILANGRGAKVEAHSDLARYDYLVVADVSGAASQSRILSAASLEQHIVENYSQIKEETYFDKASQRLKRRRIRFFNSLILDETPLPLVHDTFSQQLLFEAAQKTQLPFSKAQLSLKTRADLSDEAFYTALKPFLIEKSALSEINAALLEEVLLSAIDYGLRQKIDKAYPSHFEAPTGNRFLINYEAEEPTLSIRVTELYGLDKHPCIGTKQTPLLIELLSPAFRPVQITCDLPSFWKGSYKDVRVEMKGRYPRHFWPEDPINAHPTARAKPRGT